MLDSDRLEASRCCTTTDVLNVASSSCSCQVRVEKEEDLLSMMCCCHLGEEGIGVRSFGQGSIVCSGRPDSEGNPYMFL